MRKTLVFTFISLVSFSCKERDTKWGPEEFFEQAFTIIMNKSVKKHSVNWTELKQTVRDSIEVFTNSGDSYRAIGYTVKLINDGHSAFFPPQDPGKGAITNPLLMNSLAVPAIKTEIIGGDIGYIRLPGLFANDSLTNNYSLKIRQALLDLDKSATLSGWVIDLRKNSGGKLTSESLGLAPLFQHSLIGIASDNNDSTKNITCTNSHFFFDDYLMDSLIYDSTLSNKNKKIAVLISGKTVSAGEFLALAFKFQDNTKVFGSKTRGKTSHLELINFKSNAKLLLATHYECDKNGTKMIDGIMPDIQCDSEESISKAIEWIRDGKG